MSKVITAKVISKEVFKTGKRKDGKGDWSIYNVVLEGLPDDLQNSKFNSFDDLEEGKEYTFQLDLPDNPNWAIGLKVVSKSKAIDIQLQAMQKKALICELAELMDSKNDKAFEGYQNHVSEIKSALDNIKGGFLEEMEFLYKLRIAVRSFLDPSKTNSWFGLKYEPFKKAFKEVLMLYKSI